MRQIKFRVWSESRKKWLNECMFDMEIKGAYDFSSDASMRYNYKTDVIVEQFTGLTDKNGVDIYEGDILGSEKSDSDCWYVSHHQVVWRDSGLMGKQIGTYGAYIGIAYYTQNIGNPYVVIGNVHQNPELLEQNDDNLQS